MADLCLLPVAFFPFVTQIGNFLSRESYSGGNYRRHTYHDMQPTKIGHQKPFVHMIFYCNVFNTTPLLHSDPQFHKDDQKKVLFY